MVSVAEADNIIRNEVRGLGTMHIPFELALDRVLAEDLYADRDLPPYNRVTMDGIAIRYTDYLNGKTTFAITGIQAAGDDPIEATEQDPCIEIMTGAAMPATLDTVIRYEDLEIKNSTATVLATAIRPGQNVHLQGSDKKKGDVLVHANQVVTPAIIGIAASIGKTELLIKKLPKVVIISTGDELTDVADTPSPYQVRRSNNYTIKAVLQQFGILPDMLHFTDDLQTTKHELKKCLTAYDLILLSGGISMGKFDHIPKALEELNVPLLFHKVAQRPGKPFWFGAQTGGAVVFAFPGNPVSTFMCLQRYCLPWLTASLGLQPQPCYAALRDDFTFKPSLQYFLQVRVTSTNTGQLLAMPITGNGSGDFANLADANAFMELPAERELFMKGEVHRVWYFGG